ncbi:MAG TPA: XdhC family protein [Pyrinomonadaceae bacterium]|nr:XdhC family protein [Pyrinomonadaceae bacterium]
MTSYKAESAKQITDQIRRVLDHGSIAVLATLLESETLRIGGKLLVSAGGDAIGDLGDAGLNNAAIQEARRFMRLREEAKTMKVSEFAPELETAGDSLLMFERIEGEPRLIVAGAGHVGASLARLAALVGYDVALIDDRAEFVARELFSNKSEQTIDLIVAQSWSDALCEAVGKGRGASVAIVTRGHKQDEDCLRAAIVARPGYIGMIGSKRRTTIVLEKLREEGFDPEELKKVRAPIGLDIGAVSPEEVALAILAEIVAERRDGSGASLSAWRRA